MRVAIIGGTGHIGSFLTPRLFEAGHAVICISRGLKEPYQQHPAWRSIERVEIDRAAEEAGRDALASALPGWMRMWSSILPATSWKARSSLLRRLRGTYRAPSALRHHLGAWTERRGTDNGGRAANSIRRLRREKGCDRGLSSAPGTRVRAAGDHPASRAPGRAGLGSGQSRRQLQPGGLLHAAAGQARSSSRTSGWRPCITSTRTMWRNAFKERWSGEALLWARAFTSYRPRR